MLVGDGNYMTSARLLCREHNIPWGEMILPGSNYSKQTRKLQLDYAAGKISDDAYTNGMEFQLKILKKKYNK